MYIYEHPYTVIHWLHELFSVLSDSLTVYTDMARQSPLVHSSHLQFCCSLVHSHVSCSDRFVPRPFPPPISDHLHFASTEGVGLGDLVICGDIRETGAPVLVNPSLTLWGMSSIMLPCELSALQLSDGYYIKGIWDTLIIWHWPLCTCLLSVYLRSPCLNKSPRPYLHICVLQRLEVGKSWEGGYCFATSVV